MSETSPAAERAAPTLQDRIQRASERQILSGEFPAWMELLDFDTARVSLGSGESGAYLVVSSPTRSALNRLEFARARAQGFRARLMEKPPANAAEEEKLASDAQKYIGLVEEAEADYLADAIRDVGPGLTFRREISTGEEVHFAEGEAIPAPRTIRDGKLRRRVVFEGLPDFALTRAHAALNLIFLRAQGLDFTSDGGQGNA